MAEHPDVIIVGGGIAGLSTAYGLARAGARVRVLEQAAEFTEDGRGLQIAPNGTRILDEHGLLDEVRSRAVAPSRVVMRDAVDDAELTRLDLGHLAQRYGFPYLVVDSSKLREIFLRACRELRVDLRSGQRVNGYDHTARGARVAVDGGRTHEAEVVLAADGARSAARELLVGDALVNSSYATHGRTLPTSAAAGEGELDEVSVDVGPGCHFVRHGVGDGRTVDQVAVWMDPASVAGQAGAADGIPLVWRERWWRMVDRDPIDHWVHGRIALLGDAAHPSLQYLAQGAAMAVEDGWVLARHLARTGDWDAALAAYQAVRAPHCRRVVESDRKWGELWHLDGLARLQRNTALRDRDTHDYAFVDWLYGPTALVPEDEASPYQPIRLDAVEVDYSRVCDPIPEPR